MSRSAFTLCPVIKALVHGLWTTNHDHKKNKIIFLTVIGHVCSTALDHNIVGIALRQHKLTPMNYIQVRSRLCATKLMCN